MDILNNFYAIKDASTPTTSKETWNKRGDTLTVQLEGDFVGQKLKFSGAQTWRLRNSIRLQDLTPLSILRTQ